MKLWAGRLTGQVDEKLNQLNASIGFDSRMYKQDITGSIAHATMLGKVGVVTAEESAQIVEGLKGILSDIDSGALEIDMTSEDIHTFVEAELTKRIGTAGKKLPTARSRNDQVALDIRMYLADEIDATIALAKDLIAAFTKDPAGLLKQLGINIPQEQINKLIELVKEKLGDQTTKSLLDKIKGFFSK